MYSRSVVSLTTECILHFSAGRTSGPVKHPQEATRLRRRRVQGTKEPTEDEKICISFVFTWIFPLYTFDLNSVFVVFFKRVQAYCNETFNSPSTHVVNKGISSHLTSRFGSTTSSYISPPSPGSGGNTTAGQKQKLYVIVHVLSSRHLLDPRL